MLKIDSKAYCPGPINALWLLTYEAVNKTEMSSFESSFLYGLSGIACSDSQCSRRYPSIDVFGAVALMRAKAANAAFALIVNGLACRIAHIRIPACEEGAS